MSTHYTHYLLIFTITSKMNSGLLRPYIVLAYLMLTTTWWVYLLSPRFQGGNCGRFFSDLTEATWGVRTRLEPRWFNHTTPFLNGCAMVSFTPSHSDCLIVSAFHRWGKWSWERLSHLPKVTLLERVELDRHQWPSGSRTHLLFSHNTVDILVRKILFENRNWGWHIDIHSLRHHVSVWRNICCVYSTLKQGLYVRFG